ncbi:hypothetical protein C8R45DRAFT_1015427 [Mycena sanguinolenta]|nr:hypothetical protein C8R45DRAFT_1015427 [Mycena sanguinolenta]
MTRINWLVALFALALISHLSLRQSLPTVSFESQNSSIALRIRLKPCKFAKLSPVFKFVSQVLEPLPFKTLACSQNIPQDLKNQIPCSPESIKNKSIKNTGTQAEDTRHRKISTTTGTQCVPIPLYFRSLILNISS